MKNEGREPVGYSVKPEKCPSCGENMLIEHYGEKKCLNCRKKFTKEKVQETQKEEPPIDSGPEFPEYRTLPVGSLLERISRVTRLLRRAYSPEFILAEGLEKNDAYKFEQWFTRDFKTKYPNVRLRGQVEAVNSDKFGGKYDVIITDQRDMLELKKSLPALPQEMKMKLKPDLLQKLRILGKLLRIADELKKDYLVCPVCLSDNVNWYKSHSKLFYICETCGEEASGKTWDEAAENFRNLDPDPYDERGGKPMTENDLDNLMEKRNEQKYEQYYGSKLQKIADDLSGENVCECGHVESDHATEDISEAPYWQGDEAHGGLVYPGHSETSCAHCDCKEWRPKRN